MASECCCTAWATASTSVLVMARIASMSSISLRPMRSSVEAMGRSFVLLRDGSRQPGQDVRPAEPAGGIGIAQIDGVGGAQRVGQRDAHQPFAGADRFGGADVGREVWDEEVADGGEDLVEVVERDPRQQQLGL